MKKKANHTPLAVGAALAAIALLTIAAAPKTPNSGARLSISCTESHAVILDTHTGEAWSQELVPNDPKNSPSFYHEKTGGAK